MSHTRKIAAVAAWNSAIDTACERSNEEWRLKQLRRRRAAFRRGYADATVGKANFRKQPMDVREYYRQGWVRAKDDELDPTCTPLNLKRLLQPA